MCNAPNSIHPQEVFNKTFNFSQNVTNWFKCCQSWAKIVHGFDKVKSNLTVNVVKMGILLPKSNQVVANFCKKILTFQPPPTRARLLTGSVPGSLSGDTFFFFCISKKKTALRWRDSPGRRPDSRRPVCRTRLLARLPARPALFDTSVAGESTGR